MVQEFLTRSARTLEASVSEPDTGRADKVDRRQVLASTLIEHFLITGSLADLDNAIGLLREAVARAPTDDPELPTVLGQLGIALHLRYAATGDASNLDTAIELLRHSTRAWQPAPPRASMLGRLSSFTLERFDRAGDPSDLESAINGLQEALEDASPSSPARPGLMRALAGSLRRRYAVTLERADLARSDTAYREALAADLAGSTSLYRDALAAEVDVAPSSAVQTAREWGDWMMERGNVKAAAEAYAAGLQATLRAIGQEGLMPDEPGRIRAAEGLAARAAHAYVQTGEVEQAAVALEFDRALLLVEVLGEHPAALEPLGAVDEGLLIEYRRLIAQRTSLRNRLATRLGQISDSEEDVALAQSISALQTDLAEVRVGLDNATASIRRSAGYAARIALPSYAAEIRAVANVPLVFLAPADSAGVAVIIDVDDRASPIAIVLPEMTERAVAQAEQKLIDIPFGPPTADILALSRWLWDAVMGPVLEAVGPARRIILIPLGRLASLPLHAASTADSTMPTGHRFALDNIPMTYAPSARALARARRPQGATAHHRLLIAAPSGSGSLELPGAEAEARAISALFPDARVLLGEAATRAALLDGLHRCTALHFAGHGFASDAPLSGGLVLAQDELLTVRDVLESDISSLELAVLATGDVARPSGDRVAEMTLPAALMQAGVATVIAPQWSLTDYGAPRIMTRFYELLAEGFEPWEALRQAQREFRDARGRRCRGLVVGCSHVYGRLS